MNSKIFYCLVIVFVSLLVLGGIVIYQQVSRNDGKLHVIFCDVGQGDGIFIKTPQGIDIVVDGGPDTSILDCLGSHMTFWDRKIDLMLLSHPHADHLNGLIEVLKRYSVGAFATEPLANETAGFKLLEQQLGNPQKTKQLLFAGAFFKTKDGVRLSVLGPTKEFLDITSPNGTIGESAEFASLIILLEYGQHSFLFTGDSQDVGLVEALKRLVKPVTVLQLPHHGSKTGISKETLAQLSPKVGVISVGKNKYGHPTEKILKILSEEDIKILRTDQQGTINIISDGQSLSIRSPR